MAGPSPLGGTTSTPSSQTGFGGSTGGIGWSTAGNILRYITSGGYFCTIELGSTAPALVSEELCGDGRLEYDNGEECDDGDQTPGDGCSATCRVEPNCTGPTGCGPCVKTTACDDGVNSGRYAGCTPECTRAAHCGDGYVQPVYEECDDGPMNGIGSSKCTNRCRAIVNAH